LQPLPDPAAAFAKILPSLKTDSLRADEADFRCEFEALVALGQEKQA
jgi:hypothetical protein